MALTTGLILVAIGSLIALLLRSRYRPARPPGPYAYPLFGNLLSVPLNYPWKSFAALKNYGDVVYYHGLGNSILVLNSMESISDLLVKKGNTYSSRPYLVVACELMSLVESTAFIPFGRQWRLHRKFSRIALNRDMVKRYEGTLSGIANALTKALQQNPAAFTDHVRLYDMFILVYAHTHQFTIDSAAGQVIMSTIYGIDVRSAEDQYISAAEAAMDVISKAVLPGAFLVDLIPASVQDATHSILPVKHLPKWLPFTDFHDVGHRGRILIADLIQKPFDYVKGGIETGSAQPSFTLDVLTKDDFAIEREKDKSFETTLKWASASMYAAGQEVISSSVLNMILAMATNQDKLSLAQAELKKVLGSRSPSMEDRDNLPYVKAIIKETLRWHPPLPMAIARSSIADDSYRGYMIPKNTTIIPNIWAIAHAPDDEYPPETFAPERFLRQTPAIDPATYCFGFGRRVCPGQMLAENAIFLMTANVLQSFDIKPCVDENGTVIPIEVKYSSGLVS
ncbi:hypothetical protein H0H92_002603, partial [Tricholoma furcatifolium]